MIKTTQDILDNLEDVSELAIASHLYSFDHQPRQDVSNKISYDVINQLLDKKAQHNDFTHDLLERYDIDNMDDYKTLIQKTVYDGDYRLYLVSPQLSYQIEQYGRHLGLRDGIKVQYIDHENSKPGEIIHIRKIEEYNPLDVANRRYVENELNYHLFNGLINRDDLDNPKALINFLRFCNTGE